MFLTFYICRSKKDSVNVAQNTGTSKRLMKIAATSLQLFDKSVPSTLKDDTTTIECNLTPIYLSWRFLVYKYGCGRACERVIYWEYEN